MATGYLVQGDEEFATGPGLRAGQTFRVQQDITLEWIELDISGLSLHILPSLSIYNAGATHEPWGDCKSRDRTWQRQFSPAPGIKRILVSMQPVTLLADDSYVMIFIASTTLPPSYPKWSYLKDVATYPFGIRISSSDNGATWDKHYDDDHIFYVWGHPPAPPPPPDPPVGNVSIINFEKILTPTGMKLVLTTNVPCHLYAAFTLKEPLKHHTPIMLRGVITTQATRWCFVNWELNEQEEEGDTIYHTFIKEPWPACEVRWFAFRAKVKDIWEPTASPIFRVHRSVDPQTAYFYPDAHPETTSVDGWVRELVTCPVCSWSDVRDGAGQSYRDDSGELMNWIYASRYAGEWQSIYRTILLFDTSSLGAGRTIQSARVRVKVKGRHLTSEIWAPMLSIVSSLPHLNISLEPSDYATLGTIPLSNARGWGVFIPEATIYFDLNAAGLLAIDPVGITKLGIREHMYDRANKEPAFWEFGSARIDLYPSEHAQESHRPMLEVTYI